MNVYILVATSFLFLLCKCVLIRTNVLENDNLLARAILYHMRIKLHKLLQQLKNSFVFLYNSFLLGNASRYNNLPNLPIINNCFNPR